MSDNPSIHQYKTLRTLVRKLRSDMEGLHCILLFAYNRTGKTRLSMEFKDCGKRKNQGSADTLYFNAFTEDLFIWHNDLTEDRDRYVRINSESKFFEGLKDLALDETIAGYLNRYADFFHHVATLSELQKAVESGELYTHHFNALRSILEKTASFFGHQDLRFCLQGLDDEALYNRALNLLSHGKYAIHEPVEMMDDNKDLFRRILEAFLERYKFDLPKMFEHKTTQEDTQ